MKWLLFCLLLIIPLLLSAFLPYLNPGMYWMSGFASLAFPAIFLLCLAIVPLLLWVKKKYALVISGALLLCTKPAMKTWGLHLFPKNNVAKQAGSGQFTLMTYNASSMGIQNFKPNVEIRESIYRTIREASPDILCLQEFYTNDIPELSRNIDSLLRIGQYKYHYFTCDWIAWDTWYFGIAIFSRYPIAAANTILSNERAVGSGRSFLEADVVMNKDTVRIYSVQLTSYMFNSKDYNNLTSLRSLSFVKKMGYTFSSRAAQARHLAGLVAKSPYPVIIAGDFNDVPASYTYSTAGAGLQDVYLQTGLGFGRTLSYLSPTLRIDYILPDNHFDIHGGQVLEVPLSEHFPVMSCLSLKKH